MPTGRDHVQSHFLLDKFLTQSFVVVFVSFICTPILFSQIPNLHFCQELIKGILCVLRSIWGKLQKILICCTRDLVLSRMCLRLVFSTFIQFCEHRAKQHFKHICLRFKCLTMSNRHSLVYIKVYLFF